MKFSHNRNRIDTTLGELIATISDVAFEYSDDSDEAYHLACMVLAEILKDAALRRQNAGRHFPKVDYLH